MYFFKTPRSECFSLLSIFDVLCISLPTKKTIQKFIAFLLIIIFSISITPKPFLHKLLAKHTDRHHTCNNADKSAACIHNSFYHCQLDNLVVNTEYFSSHNFPDISLEPFYLQHAATLFSSYSSSVDNVNESRGPPSVE